MLMEQFSEMFYFVTTLMFQNIQRTFTNNAPNCFI